MSSPPEITLSQLRALAAICDNDLNVTAAAQQLNIAQPSMSKKLSTLEQAIGKPLFYRNGKRFQYETELCREALQLARDILLKCDNLQRLGQQADNTHTTGELTIGTTHTQARYVLPDALAPFCRDYPNIAITIRQGAPSELVRLLSSNHLDFVICTEVLETNSNFRTLASFSWNRCLIMPADHPLASARTITLAQLARHPIVTYTRGFTGRAAFDAAFATQGLAPRVRVSATDADVIKTYVRLGFGVGVIAEMAYEKKQDADLQMRPASHLFPDMQVRLAYQREKLISAAMQRFIELFCRQTKQSPDLSNSRQNPP